MSVFLVFSAITRAKIDRKGLIIMYSTVSMLVLFTVSAKLFIELSKNKTLINIFVGGAIVLSIIFFIELVYLAITHKGDAKSKRLILIGFLLIIIAVVPIAIIIMLGL